MLFGCTCKPDEYEAVSKIGFDYVEFPCRAICEMDDSIFNALCRKVEKIGVPVMGMNLYCPPEVIIAGPGFSADNTLIYARKAASRASSLGVRTVGIGSPRSRTLPDGFNRNMADDQLIEFLRITAAEFKKYNITVAMEALGPCFCNYINTVSDAYEIACKANVDNLKILADFYNMEHSGEADTGLRPYMDHLVHMHISDDDGTPTQRSYLHPGKYPIHKDRIRELRRIGYIGSLTIEIDIPFDKERANDNLQFLKSM